KAARSSGLAGEAEGGRRKTEVDARPLPLSTSRLPPPASRLSRVIVRPSSLRWARRWKEDEARRVLPPPAFRLPPVPRTPPGRATARRRDGRTRRPVRAACD